MATSALKSAAAKVNWQAISTSFGLKQSAISDIHALRKRNDQARSRVAYLESQPTTVDFAYYKSVLKNQAVVEEIELAFKNFKVQTFDVKSHLDAIAQFEEKAVANAEKTAVKIDAELDNLQATLANIEQVRPMEQISVDDVVKAKPEIDAHVEKMLRKGQWEVKGYKETFGDLNIM
ncbi:ATP synthase subunit d, mitochondrial [Neolecta irregularis DAH-3]|uniref:ATP synthase subunit d, mitochondrial n=1 Tax=Neolecta irregularis (strain DAH-3) TaxID=1198029 RepID=A0A1U7LNC2_NEOID|nr:ATP synthase subunit d, mitochondrial [Neolecta irregularis DAH-3]|eukprot:OLL24139.1 ATP synthase subunit d, mitochondrial [Neolecta irregularis DAH-3]